MRLALLPVLVAALLVAAACGGGDEGEPTSEAFAEDFCSAAADWRAKLEAVVSGIASPSSLSADGIRDAVDDGLEATETFIDEVEELEAPETEAGQEVEAIVDSMAGSVQSTVDELRSEFDDGSDSVQDLLGKVAQAGTQIGQLQQDLQSSIAELENVDTGELRSELESNEDCAAARSGS